MLKKINAKLRETVVGCECAIASPVWSENGVTHYEASIYFPLHGEVDSSLVAALFHSLGATQVRIELLLHCDEDGDRNGFVIDYRTGKPIARAWLVSFNVPS